AYNEAEGVRLRGPLNVEALERALNVIVDRHELLRSTIKLTQGEPTVEIHARWPLELKKIDLSQLPAAQRLSELHRLLVDEPRRRYDLESSPGIRATLVREEAECHVFILMMHHI